MSVRIVKQKKEEKYKMYSKFTKTQLINMLITATEHFDTYINKINKGYTYINKINEGYK
jgi:hypothetical protein